MINKDLLIDKDLINAKKWLKMPSGSPVQGSKEVNDLVKMYIQGLHLSFSLVELTEDKDVFAKLAYQGERAPDGGFYIDDALIIWLTAFGFDMIKEHYELPKAAMNDVNETIYYLESCFEKEDNPDVMMDNLQKSILNLNKYKNRNIKISDFY